MINRLHEIKFEVNRTTQEFKYLKDIIKLTKGNALLYNYLTKNNILYKVKGIYVFDVEIIVDNQLALDIENFIYNYNKDYDKNYLKKYGVVRNRKKGNSLIEKKPKKYTIDDLEKSFKASRMGNLLGTKREFKNFKEYLKTI